MESFLEDLYWALQILCQASFKFSPSHCLKLRISCSGVITRIGRLAIMTEKTSKHMGHGKRQAKIEEEIGKDRANKTARVKWGRGKREENGK